MQRFPLKSEKSHLHIGFSSPKYQGQKEQAPHHLSVKINKNFIHLDVTEGYQEHNSSLKGPTCKHSYNSSLWELKKEQHLRVGGIRDIKKEVEMWGFMAKGEGTATILPRLNLLLTWTNMNMNHLSKQKSPYDGDSLRPSPYPTGIMLQAL